MRLIDVEPFDVFFATVPAEYDNESYSAGMEFVLEKMDKAPTVDAEPVRHERWIQPDRRKGYRCCSACYEGERLCGVAMVGRPVSRYLDDGMTLEVNRLCTDGTKNACSMLYSASWRAAKALGYKRIFTYTRESENGASLRSAGWICDGEAGGTHWTGKRYKGRETVMDEMKVRWRKEAAKWE